nr:hypothetical protein [Tanacetum cinerariifolium]
MLSRISFYVLYGRKEHIMVFRFANEIDTLAIRRIKKWKDKLPTVVLKAEEIVYLKANSE